MSKKIKDIGLGKYPTIHKLNKYKRACLINEDERKEMYYYFKLKGKIIRRKLF
jgi:hypothetical protein